MNRILWSLSIVIVATVVVAGHACAQAPPAQDMVLWVKADAGVVSDAFGVTEWQDQSGNGNDATWHVGSMKHETADFGNGTHDVIRFFKDGFFDLNTAPFRLPDITVYAVVQQADTAFDDRIAYFSNYSNAVNWGYGYHMDLEIIGGNPYSRMFTSAGTQATISDFVMAGPAPGMHYITTQIDTTNTDLKSTYVDGTLIGGPEAVPGLSYFVDAETASIGTLGQLPIPSFYFAGDIAEILVYSSVSDAQRSAVESYLDSKYFDLPGVDGDYNDNGVVDAADYVTWRDGGPLANEGVTPGSNSVEDYDFWRSRFGATSGSGSLADNAAVPEPTSAALLFLAIVGGLLIRGSRGV